MKKFEIGKTYSMRSIGDHDCIWTYTVTARTAAMITITDGEETKKCKVIKKASEAREAEAIRPLGTYSMCPTLYADSIVEQESPVEEMVDEEEPEQPEEVNEEVIVKTINDVIYRNLPKYVQNAIDYCDYVDGVYRINVNTEFGSKEIEAEKWAEASASVKTFCKTGA